MRPIPYEITIGKATGSIRLSVKQNVVVRRDLAFCLLAISVDAVRPQSLQAVVAYVVRRHVGRRGEEESQDVADAVRLDADGHVARRGRTVENKNSVGEVVTSSRVATSASYNVALINVSCRLTKVSVYFVVLSLEVPL